ncbi:10571_t:CDS:1, partial [Funneliformis caledonium]
RTIPIYRSCKNDREIIVLPRTIPFYRSYMNDSEIIVLTKTILGIIVLARTISIPSF